MSSGDSILGVLFKLLGVMLTDMSHSSNNVADNAQNKINSYKGSQDLSEYQTKVDNLRTAAKEMDKAGKKMDKAGDKKLKNK